MNARGAARRSLQAAAARRGQLITGRSRWSPAALGAARQGSKVRDAAAAASDVLFSCPAVKLGKGLENDGIAPTCDILGFSSLESDKSEKCSTFIRAQRLNKRLNIIESTVLLLQDWVWPFSDLCWVFRTRCGSLRNSRSVFLVSDNPK